MNDNPDVLIKARKSGGIGELTLNQPGARNALTMDMRHELTTLLSDFIADPDIRAIVIAAEGKAFCAGGDLKSLMQETPASMLARQQGVQHLIRQLATGDTPFVAAVDGFALGAGLSLALACDIVVAGPAAKFGAVFGKVGLAPDLGLTWTLPARVGPGRARLLTMTGRLIGRDEAVDWGLADIAAEDAQQSAIEIAQEICSNAPISNGLAKRGFAAPPASLDQALDLEAVAQTVLQSTGDFREGVAAFTEKRPPRFSGT